MTSPSWSALPQMAYLLALNNDSYDDPTKIQTIAPPGEVGGKNVWTDISGRIKKHKIVRGRQHELGRFESGTLDLVGDNNDGWLNPWNTSSPYSQIGPFQGVPCQVLAVYNQVVYPRFTGVLHNVTPKWSDNFTGVATMKGADAFRLFALANCIDTAPPGDCQSYPNAVLADAPINYWRLNQGSATEADLGYANTPATYQGAGAQSVEPGALDICPTSEYFDTLEASGWLTAPATSVFPAPTASSCSVEFWYLPHTSGNVGYATIYGTGQSANGQINAYSSGTGFGMLVHGSLPYTGAQNWFTGNGTWSQVNTWHYVVLVWSGGGGPGAFTFYVDGVAFEPAQVANAGAPYVANQGPVGICYTTVGIDEPTQSAGLQELAIYDYALTQAQVAAHLAAARSNTETPGGTVWPQQFSGERIRTVLSYLGWGAGATNIVQGNILVQASGTLSGTRALSHMQLVELTEDGALFVDARGVVQFVDHGTLVGPSYTTPVSVFGDLVPTSSSGQLGYQPGIEMAADDLDLWTQAVVGNLGQGLVTANNPAAMARYGQRTYPGTQNLLGTSQDVAQVRAEALVNRFSTPVTRIRSIQINPLDDPATLFPEVLSRELLDCIQVTRTGGPGGPLDPANPGTALSITANVERITDEMTAASETSGGMWTVTYGLANAFPPGD